jgi:type I restriction enzyme S subunit
MLVMEMCSKKQQIPDIRFNGFTDAWEQRKFSNIVNRVSVQSNDSNLPKVEFEDIISGEGRLNKDISQKFDSRRGTVFEPGYILYGKLRPYLKNWLFPNFKGIALGDFWVFEQNNSSSIFDYYLIQSDKYQTVANLSSGTKMPRSDWKTVSETVFNIPISIEEQDKIGNFFKQLDDTIALHQRQLDNYKELKKAMLQKMFPREGEKVPEVRFDGFTEEWEQRKLGEILIERNDQISENEEYPLMSFVQGVGVTPKGERYDRSFLVKDDAKKYKKTELGDFIYSSNNLETGSIGFNKMGKAVISPVYSIFESKNETESQFIGIFSTRKDFINKMVHYRQGVVYGQWRIHEKDFLNIEVSVPSFEEQQKIIIFFKQLDDTIALYQQKIINYQTVKSALFKKMFV